MVDIVILLGLFTRVEIKDETMKNFENMTASVISFLFKASKTQNDTPVINSLFQ